MRLLRREVTIAAPAGTVFRLLTTVDGLLRWMAVDAVVEAVPDGRLEWTHADGSTMLGRFIDLVPDRRIVFRYGWKDGHMGLAPASSVVEIDLDEVDGKTTLVLVHRAIPEEAVDDHARGWGFFLDRLQRVAGSP